MHCSSCWTTRGTAIHWNIIQFARNKRPSQPTSKIKIAHKNNGTREENLFLKRKKSRFIVLFSFSFIALRMRSCYCAREFLKFIFRSGFDIFVFAVIVLSVVGYFLSFSFCCFALQCAICIWFGQIRLLESLEQFVLACAFP